MDASTRPGRTQVKEKYLLHDHEPHRRVLDHYHEDDEGDDEEEDDDDDIDEHHLEQVPLTPRVQEEAMISPRVDPSRTTLSSSSSSFQAARRFFQQQQQRGAAFSYRPPATSHSRHHQQEEPYHSYLAFFRSPPAVPYPGQASSWSSSASSSSSATSTSSNFSSLRPQPQHPLPTTTTEKEVERDQENQASAAYSSASWPSPSSSATSSQSSHSRDTGLNSKTRLVSSSRIFWPRSPLSPLSSNHPQPPPHTSPFYYHQEKESDEEEEEILFDGDQFPTQPTPPHRYFHPWSTVPLARSNVTDHNAHQDSEEEEEEDLEQGQRLSTMALAPCLPTSGPFYREEEEQQQPQQDDQHSQTSHLFGEQWILANSSSASSSTSPSGPAPAENPVPMEETLPQQSTIPKPAWSSSSSSSSSAGWNLASDDVAPEAGSDIVQYHRQGRPSPAQWGVIVWKDMMVPAARRVAAVLEASVPPPVWEIRFTGVSRQADPPLPHLFHQHQVKMSQLLPPAHDDDDGEDKCVSQPNGDGGHPRDNSTWLKRRAPLLEDLPYDFCLVLQPQEVYGYWAHLLDFRSEMLGGPEVVEAIEQSWQEQAVTGPSPTNSSSSFSGHEEEALDVVSDILVTPTTGMYRRKGTSSSTSLHAAAITTSSSSRDETHPTPVTHATPEGRTTPGAQNRSVIRSPGLYSLADSSRFSIRNMSRMSVFERAMGSPPSELGPATGDQSEAGQDMCDQSTTLLGEATPMTVGSSMRRRWGNQHTLTAPQTAAGPGTAPTASAATTLLSPPVRSLTRGSSILRRPVTVMAPRSDRQGTPRSPSVVGTTTPAAAETSTNRADPNTLRVEDIPHQVIPRGIAARSNGLLQFLSALKRGLVVRRHRPGQEATFCKIISADGGDTIQFHFMEEHDALLAFQDQRMRYNKDLSKAIPQPWSCIQVTADPSEDGADHLPTQRSDMPDYVAAQRYRDQMYRDPSLSQRMIDLAQKVTHRGSFKVADMIEIHPARNLDPRSDSGDLGTTSFRRSKSDYAAHLSFSLILKVAPRLPNRSNKINPVPEMIDEYKAKWHKGEGTDSMFKCFDFEAATEGEYWLILRGFLLLHRDAAVGRFAEQRAAGIGCHYGRIELEQREQADTLEPHNLLHRDEFHEPTTISYLKNLIIKMFDVDVSELQGYTLPEAVPPPSDYFLGFRSPGTTIWSRLRLAGLETTRVYGLDPCQVMIKVRCPPDRLMDVAEVLRVQLKTRDGTFAAFREDLQDYFVSLDDPLEATNSKKMSQMDFHFRSSIRQTIIDFIIGSRIRDSGAELGQNTDLGKMVQVRTPLHMREKLDAIYESWFFFWHAKNWEGGRDGRSMTHAGSKYFDPVDKVSNTPHNGNHKLNGNGGELPGLARRILVGCFYQPLDSIEQYFGEKVAFYFAWLQHTAAHLVFLSVAGLLLFLCQLASHNWDHPLRPYFSVVVMLWTFTVLVNWRKRANFLAYKWGTMNYQEQETTRPQFHGDYTRDEITGEWVVSYPKWKRWMKYTISFPLTIVFTIGTLILILWVHANRDLQLARYTEQKTSPGSEEFQFEFALSAIGKKSTISQVDLNRKSLGDPAFWLITVGMPSMLGLFLPLLNFMLMKLSVWLNDFENYRTESEYRTSLVIKVFSFRFVCYFATLYYYAFISVGSTQAIENGILRVGSGVLIYTTVAQWWQNFLFVCFPILMRKLRLNYRERRLCEMLQAIELEEIKLSSLAGSETDDELKKRRKVIINKRLLLEQAQDDTWLELMNPQHEGFVEYIQAVVQFTFVSCFSVVLPITPLVCLFNYLVGMRLDAYKLCRCRRRPLAAKTGGIGIWEHLLHIVAVISVLTNCWLMGFTSSQLTWIADKTGEVGLFAVVVCWEHIMLLIKYVMQTTISPLPKNVVDAMKREQYDLDQQRNMSMRRVRRQQHEREEDTHQSISFRHIQS